MSSGSWTSETGHGYAVGREPADRTVAVPRSRKTLSVVGICVLGALTVVSAAEGSAIPASAAGSTSPNLVVNGDFAAPTVTASAGALALSPQSQAGFTGWKVTAPAANLDASDYLNLAPGGNQAFVLDNGFGLPHTPDTGISQVVATTPGSAYSLTLEYSAIGQQGCPVGSERPARPRGTALL